MINSMRNTQLVVCTGNAQNFVFMHHNILENLLLLGSGLSEIYLESIFVLLLASCFCFSSKEGPGFIYIASLAINTGITFTKLSS